MSYPQKNHCANCGEEISKSYLASPWLHINRPPGKRRMCFGNYSRYAEPADFES